MTMNKDYYSNGKPKTHRIIEYEFGQFYNPMFSKTFEQLCYDKLSQRLFRECQARFMFIDIDDLFNLVKEQTEYKLLET